MNSFKQRFGIKPLLAVAASSALALCGAQAADRSWTGGTASYTNAANWTGGVVPGPADVAINNNGTNNVVQINAGNPDWSVGELVSGNLGNGAFSQSGQTLTLSSLVRSFHLGAAPAATGVYNLSGGTVNYGGGQFNVGELGTGIFNMSGGTINGTGNFAINRGTSLSAVTATMDGGVGKTGYTWFEQGFYTLDPSEGLPAPGTIFASVSNANYTFQMPPSYTNNNVFFVNTSTPPATITLSPATAVSVLSLLGSSGHGPVGINYTVHHADTSTETGTISALDWFPPGADQTNSVVVARGRCLGDGTGIQNIADNPRLLSIDIAVANSSSPVTSIDLSYNSGATNGYAAIFAVSGSTGGAFSPITVTGFNQDAVIEAGAQIQVSPSVTDVMTQTGGTMNISGESYVGQIGNGIYNFGGTAAYNSSNWFVIGRGGGTGTMNMTGGSILHVTGGGQPAFIVGSEDGGASAGTLNQSAGSIATTAGEYWIGNGGQAKGTNNVSGTASVTVSNWIAIGRGGYGELNLSGSATITKAGNGNVVAPGSGIGVINQSGGTFTVLSGQVWLPEGGNGTWNLTGGAANFDVLHICQNAGSVGTFNLDGGVLTVGEVTPGNLGTLSTLSFNGGTIRPTSSSINFIHDLAQALVGPGGAIFDSQGFDITVSQNLTANGGGLTKNGAGTLTLSGFNSYAGPTVVNNGTLAVTTDSSGAGDYTVASGAALSVKVQFAGAQLNAANVTFASPSPILNVDLGSFGNPSAAPINASGNVAVNGAVTLNLTHGAPALGQFPLIKYGTTSGAGSFALGSVPVGLGLYVSNNVANASIDLVITNVNLPRWEGLAGGNWDVGITTNWINSGTLLPTTFAQNNAVLFNDSALGTTNVNITTTVNPNGVTVNNSVLPYTFQGTGKIGGAAGLTKSGTAALVIANTTANTYTGATVVANGILSVPSLANGGTGSAIGASSASSTNLVLAGGNLTYTGPTTAINRGYSVTASNSTITTANNLGLSGNVIAGALGGFFKAGAGRLAYTTAGSNVLSGSSSTGYIVQDGSVLFDGTAVAQTNLIQGRLGVDSATLNAAVTVSNTVVTTTGNIDIGDTANTGGSVTVNGSNSIVTVGGWLVFGDGGESGGTFTLNDGTLNIRNGRILIGGRAGSVVNTLNINGGLINKAGGQFDIGDGGWNGSGARTGVVNQAGGIINSFEELWVGQDVNGVGVYNMSGGTFNVSNWVAIGRSGANGTFNMTGGTLTKNNNGNFIIGTGAGNNGLTSVGTLNQSGGTLTSANEYWIGENALDIGTNNISGTAVVNWNNWVSIGRHGKGVVNFSGGTITRANSGSAIVVGDNVGGPGNGYFNQTGGSLFSANELWIGQGGSSTGRYDLAAGTVVVTNWIAVGRGGAASGTLNISGGALTKAGGNGSRLTIGSGGVGTVNQTGGFITNIVADTFIGESQPGTWNMNGGSATLSVARIPNNANVVSALNLNGGTMEATELTGNATGKGTINFNGSLLVARSGANTNFLHDIATNLVLAGGVRIDSGANAISVPQVLRDGGTGGGLIKLGSGALYLNGVNTYTGGTVVSNGALGGSGTIAGSVTVVPGAALAPGGAASVGTLTVGGNVTLNGNVSIDINKALAQSNDVTSVTGTLTSSGTGTVTVNNLGAPAVTAGDKFVLFNKPVAGGGSLVVTGGSATWTNLLAVDGSIVALTGAVSTTPVTLTNSFSGGNLTLTWPTDHTGWSLQVQTNTRAVGLGTNWFAVPGSSATNSVTIPTSQADPTVFYRLTYP